MIGKWLEDLVNEELEFIKKNEHRTSQIKHEDQDHYKGVIAGQRKAYEKILSELRLLRRKV